MTTSKVEMELPLASGILLTDDAIEVDLGDGRSISAPLQWFPRLVHATREEREDWRLIAGGEGVHWDRLDEDVSVEALLAGRPSMESQASLKRWLESRS